VSDLSNDEDAAPHTRLSKHTAGKVKGASSVEDVHQEVCALELQVKGMGNELHKVGERLRRLLDALPPTL